MYTLCTYFEVMPSLANIIYTHVVFRMLTVRVENTYENYYSALKYS